MTSGGSLIYVSDRLKSKSRNDIAIYKPKELESTYIEIISPSKKNTIIGCIYLTPLLKKITAENKNIFLTGDYNINLLNTESDKHTSSFLNNLTSNLFRNRN